MITSIYKYSNIYIYFIFHAIYEWTMSGRIAIVCINNNNISHVSGLTIHWQFAYSLEALEYEQLDDLEQL